MLPLPLASVVASLLDYRHATAGTHSSCLLWQDFYRIYVESKNEKSAVGHAAPFVYFNPEIEYSDRAGARTSS